MNIRNTGKTPTSAKTANILATTSIPQSENNMEPNNEASRNVEFDTPYARVVKPDG